MNAGNFGDDVDIWAPFDTLTTPTRDSIALDADNFGQDELQVFRAPARRRRSSRAPSA